MKLLVAIPSSDPNLLSANTLRWLPRSGFAIKIFMPKDADRNKYMAAIDDANYEEYLDLTYKMLSIHQNPIKYAQAKGYDLLAVVPPALKAWNDDKERDKMVIQFQTDIAAARNKIAKDPKLHQIKFDNGAIVVRI